MGYTCKGICTLYHGKKKRNGGIYTYIDGYRRCSICALWILTKEIRCACCGSKYRYGAQTNLYRQKKNELCARM